MSSALYALGRWAFRARWLVLSLWLVVLVLAMSLAGLLGIGTTNVYSIPGTESQQALDALARTFPEVSGTSAQLVAVAPDGGDVTDPDFEAAVEDAATAIAAIPQVSSATSPYSSVSSANIASDKSAVIVPIQLSVVSTYVEPSTSAALQQAGVDLQAVLPDGSQVAVGGQLFSQTSTGISITELLGILIAFVVLVITFASAVAAGIPLATALLGVGVALSLVLAATRFWTITSTTPLLALMLGLAVGIDYALFIIARHQDQLKHGLEPEEAAARSIATSGSAVVFAAMTVIIALLGLAVAGIPFLTTMGIAAAAAVALAVAVSLTLTPALLGFARWHAVSRRFRPARKDAALPAPSADAALTAVPTDAAAASTDAGAISDAESAGPANADAKSAGAPLRPKRSVLEAAAADSPIEPSADEQRLVDPEEAKLEDDDDADQVMPERAPRRGFFGGWVRAVTRWPIVTVILIVGILGAAAVPAAHLRLALPDAGSIEEGEPARITYDLIAEHFGPGYNGPLIVTGSVIQSTDPVGLMTDLGNEIAGVDGVAAVPLSTPNETGDTGIVQVIPEGSPDSEATADLVATLRSMHGHFEAEYGVDLSVTGYTAAGIDISARLAGALLPFGAIVVGLSLVLLAMVFRSIVVPVTAALGYVLSIAAALGLSTLVFVDGFLAGPLNVADVGSVVSFMPIILMGVLFGLAMDYEVFLVSRMREDYVYRHDAHRAIEEGFVASARVVTAAATIMFAVFAAFIPEGDASIQPIAFGLAIGVVIDAFIVRMCFIPAVLRLFGDRAWWIPRWLDRVLPHFDIEGEGIAEELALADWPGDAEIVIAADAIRAGDGPVIGAMVRAGEALVVHGATAGARTDLLMALGGRFPVSSGRCKVGGLMLPVRASAVRRRTAYLRAVDVASDPSALDGARRPRVGILMIDAIDDVADPDARQGLRAALTELIAPEVGRDPVTLVVACREPDVARRMLPAGLVVHAAEAWPVTVPSAALVAGD